MKAERVRLTHGPRALRIELNVGGALHRRLLRPGAVAITLSHGALSLNWSEGCLGTVHGFGVLLIERHDPRYATALEMQAASGGERVVALSWLGA